MATVLITYSTPPQRPPDPPEPADLPHPPASLGDGGTPGASANGHDRCDRTTGSVASATAGIDESIAAGIADELSRSGHQVTCRPCVATPVTGGYDLVVDVDGLQVTHRNTASALGPLQREGQTPILSAAPPTEPPAPGEESSIPLTWGADWRAVEAWSRTLGDGFARYLELRTELTRVRAELEHCRALLDAATGPAAPEPAPRPAYETPHPPGRERSRAPHTARRLSPAGPSREV